MVRMVQTDPSWGRGLQSLSDALFPDPRKNLQAVAQAWQAKQAAEQTALTRAQADQIRRQQERLPAASAALADIMAASGVEYARQMPQNQYSVPAGRPPATEPVDLRPLTAYALGGGGNAQTIASSLPQILGALSTQTGQEDLMRVGAQQFGRTLGPDYAGTTARADTVSAREAREAENLQRVQDAGALARTQAEQAGAMARLRYKTPLEHQNEQKINYANLINDLALKDKDIAAAAAQGDKDRAAALEIERLQLQNELERLRLELQNPTVGAGETAYRPGMDPVSGPMEPITAGTDERVLDPNTREVILEAVPEGDGGVSGASGPYAGTGQSQQDSNIILAFNRAFKAGVPLTDADYVRYAQAYTRQYGPKTEIRTTPRGDIPVRIEPAVPPGLLNPETFFNRGTPTAVPPSPSAPGPRVGVEPRTTPEAVAPAQPGPVSAGPVIPGTEQPVKPRTEQQAKMYQYGQRAAKGAYDLFSLFGYNPDTGTLDPNRYRPDLWTGIAGSMPEMFRGYLVGPADEHYMTARATALNPVIRADSGAAVPLTEYPQYAAQFIPSPGEEEATVRMKFDNLLLTISAFEELGRQIGRDPSTLSDDEIRAMQPQYQAIKSRIWQQVSERRGQSGQQRPDIQLEQNRRARIEADAGGGTQGTTSGGVTWERVN